jgi:hypothetical protein
MYSNLSRSYGDWSIDLKLAEYIVGKVKEGYIDKYRDEDIPTVLKPLLVDSISKNIALQNEKNKNVTLEEVSGEAELKAIELLRNYEFIDYRDAINIFCEGYDFAMENKTANISLSEFTSEELLTELKNRL